MATFGTKENDFIYEGKPVRLLSGAIHYFRVVPEYWRDRLTKLKAGGFNTVETYVPWNFHEPKQGQFRFDGMADLVRFIQIAGELGLFVIVRPSPYICAEWEFGGLPAWLLAESDMQLRCYDETYLKHVEAYYEQLLPRLKPLLCTNGGPIIAMQIENEYGSYGNDVRYLDHLRQVMVNLGIDVLLFTSDGPTDHMLQGGMVPGVLETVNFGSGAQAAFAKLREYQPVGPLMCMEFWNGWFDHWNKAHHTRDAADAAKVLDDMLQENASVNFYMFHGGTNFGFYNGANCMAENQLEPTITSYDYDSPLSESGVPTAKFFAVRDTIARYEDIGELVLPEPIPTQAYGKVTMTSQASLFSQLDSLSEVFQRTTPVPMEKLGQDYGFILYKTTVSGPRAAQELVIQDVRDRALVFVNGKLEGVIERGNQEQKISLAIPAEGAELSILVENMGRTNYGPYLWDPKGITEGVRLGFQFLYHWTIHTLPLDDLSQVIFTDITTPGVLETTEIPTFYRGTLEVEEPHDTFLRLEGWTKGVVYVNGVNLGRYWNAGPQKTLYVPGPLLKKGENEIVIFELHGVNEPVVAFEAEPDLG